jgi:hypothetical protein
LLLQVNNAAHGGIDLLVKGLALLIQQAGLLLGQLQILLQGPQARLALGQQLFPGLGLVPRLFELRLELFAGLLLLLEGGLQSVHEVVARGGLILRPLRRGPLRLGGFVKAGQREQAQQQEVADDDEERLVHQGLNSVSRISRRRNGRTWQIFSRATKISPKRVEA